MNRVLEILGLAFVFVSGSACASEFATFYESGVSERWSIRGVVLKEEALAPTCVAEIKWNDGSYVHLSKDIDENMIYLWLYRPAWRIGRKEISVRFDFYAAKDQLSYASLRGGVRGGNSVNVPIDDPKAFLERFILSDRILVSVPGNKLDVPVDKPIEIVHEFGKCVDAWDKAKSKIANGAKNEPAATAAPQRGGLAIGGKIPYGSKGGTDATVMGQSGIDTDDAVIRAAITREDALSYCNAQGGGSISKCLKEMAEYARSLKPEVRANCTTREFTDFFGRRYAFLGPNPDRDKEDGESHARYILKNLGTGDVSDGTNSTGYFTNSALFEALCPKTAPLDW